MNSTGAAIDTLCAGLDALGSAALLLDERGRVVYATAPATSLLGLVAEGRDWDDLWPSVAPDAPTLNEQARRTLIRNGGAAVPVRASLRSLGRAGLSLVKLEDLAGEEAREYEVLRIFRESQEQADDLFALYQITQFFSTATRLDQLCATFLRELERVTSADVACLYLTANDGALQPNIWHGLAQNPPMHGDADCAAYWLGQLRPDLEALALPLLAGDQLVGLALLGHHGTSGRELRFLHTLAKEMGAALLAMAGRQALQTQEQKLEAIVMGTTDAIIQVDAGRRVRDFNPAASDLTGSSAAEALGQRCADVLGCGDGAGCGMSCPFEQVLLSREPIPSAEMKIGKRTVAAAVAALDLGPEVGPAAVAIMRDISKQKQIEQMKADFFSEVSHQLRTPLALLRGYSDTMLHLALTPAEQQLCVTGVSEATLRLERLVEQIIDMTRIEEGRLQLRLEPVRLDDVIHSALGALPAENAASRLVLDLPAALPMLDADHQRLEQALINLLDNALKYSPAGSPVRISASQQWRRIMVQVEDAGIGIPAEEQTAVFGKFNRASNALSLQLPGTGLGLFIARTIIEAHGGRIMLASAPGQGTCVTSWLPIKSEE